MKSLVKGEDSELRIAYDEFHRSIENENGAVRNATLVEVQQNLTISTRTESKTEVIVTHTERMNQYIEDQQDREAHIASTSERDDILKSLSSVNFHNKHIDILAKHQPNTGQWLLKSDKFQQWFRSHTCNTLGCTGIAGAGKTVLTSVAVDYLQQSVCGSDIAIVYLYCDYKDPKTRNEVELILSIAQQLAGQMDAVTPELKAFCEKKKDNRRGITNEDRLSVVESLVACFSRVYVCVDAIDECPEDNRNGFLWFLKKMQSLLYIVMTSRPHVDLKSYFPNMSQLEIVAPESDITEYLTSKIERDASLARLLARDPQLRGDILGGISKKAEGM
ncbi:hypothetical protein BO71DRAFT_51045 [Aspergillus ellipticus CBS 707.79]|uniref:Nephrocystin 3-like N-terminal domain-containing protein n=1 Tax=Aspergillus ellipticus CBS 707.79 TaxID=1448320 RepID=A0A319D2U2_9EURO|nr:hypothetical protein BO71DRAFT_51045 [Aspergillus ellipticus CBS 707.79]